MNKNTSVTMAAGATVAGILTLAVLAMAIQHQAFAQAYNQGSSYDNNKQQHVATITTTSVATITTTSVATMITTNVATMTTTNVATMTTNNQVKRSRRRNRRFGRSWWCWWRRRKRRNQHSQQYG